MGEVSKKVSEFVERYGSKIFFLLFLLEFLITSFIWIAEKITIELGFAYIFMLNSYALLPYIINLTIKRKEPNKREHVIIIDFYSSAIFWGISRIIDFYDFNVLFFCLVLAYLGIIMSIIYLILNLKPKHESLSSKRQFRFSIFFVLINFILLILVLIMRPTFLLLGSAVMQLFWLIFYLALLIALLILIFKPESKNESP